MSSSHNSLLPLRVWIPHIIPAPTVGMNSSYYSLLALWLRLQETFINHRRVHPPRRILSSMSLAKLCLRMSLAKLCLRMSLAKLCLRDCLSSMSLAKLCLRDCLSSMSLAKLCLRDWRYSEINLSWWSPAVWGSQVPLYGRQPERGFARGVANLHLGTC